ncbi:MaoC/PaaZ C-terminal domain-containing protein [Microbacterium sp. CPCC 204701]|uniref:MaoC/PaaZ C-terminal domain-containing protein n=1 Tax=Microbacterium sp. CPCC 204701 TaxID=2493084 RepID=UPI00197B4D67|nr:MaoC/PaaZ C-terminal domain-containing protein [Microbacterium sp. CPCC 204701]
MTALRATLAELPGLVGRELGPTPFREMTQGDVDAFAALTGDAQWIHVDAERAAPFGGTIVHGLLILGLLGGVWGDLLDVADARRALNYGLDRVRFLAPVPVGARIAAAATLAAADARVDGIRLTLDVRFLVHGADRPAVVAASLVLFQH